MIDPDRCMEQIQGSVADLLAGVTHESVQCMQSRRRCCEGWGSSWKDGGRDKKGEGSQWWKKDDDPWDEDPNDMSGIDVRKCKKCKHNWSYVREGGELYIYSANRENLWDPYSKGSGGRWDLKDFANYIEPTLAKKKKKNRGKQRKVWWAKVKGWKDAGEPEFQPPSDEEEEDPGQEGQEQAEAVPFRQKDFQSFLCCLCFLCSREAKAQQHPKPKARSCEAAEKRRDGSPASMRSYQSWTKVDGEPDEDTCRIVRTGLGDSQPVAVDDEGPEASGPPAPEEAAGTGSLVLHFRRTRLLAVAKTAKPATSKGKFAAKAAKKEPKAAAKGTATPKSQAVKTEPTEAVGKIGMERGQLSGLLTSLSYQCKAKKATPEHRAAAAKILSDYKAADVSGKSKILEKLVQSGMHCLDWANELTKNTEVQHEEANEFVKGFMTRSKILELNGLNESNLSEQVAADTLQDLLRESEERFKHTRQEQPHKNKLLHRYFYKMQKESTERDSATDTTRHSQTGTMDGGSLGSLMDAFGSGAASSIEVDMKGAFNKNVLEIAASPANPRRTWSYRDESFGHTLSKHAVRRGGEFSMLGVAKLIEKLPDLSVLDEIAELLRTQACTPYELALLGLPEKLVPLLTSGATWPWPTEGRGSQQALEALVPAFQWLLGLTESLPVAAPEGQMSGIDCLVRPLELTLDRDSPTSSGSRTLFVEPLLRLEDLERFVLQTTAPEDEEYLEWCRRAVSRRIAERPLSSASQEAPMDRGLEPWKTALVTNFEMVAKLPVHTLQYDDGEEAKLLLHLREVVLLPATEADEEERSASGPAAESATQDPGAPEAEDSVVPATDGDAAEEAKTAEGEAAEAAAPEADPSEKVHKLIVRMPMVQAGDIPFDMVWADMLENGEALLQASPDGTWTALGWKDRAEMREAFSQGLQATGEGTLARGMTREEGVLLLERMDELADAMEVVVDRNDVPTSQKPSKPTPTAGPICRRVQLDLPCGSTVGVAVWEHETGALDVVDQTGRFLPSVPAKKVASAHRRARHAPGRSLPLELSVLGLTAGVDSKASGEAGGSYEWQFAGDSGWCNFEPAAARLLEAAQQRGEENVTVRSGSNRYLVDIRAGTQMNMTHPGRRVRRVRRLATGGGSGGASRAAPVSAPALERHFSAVDRGPVNDFQHKVCNPRSSRLRLGDLQKFLRVLPVG
ncbi:unnamed protein product [Symbiodinium natans]|uniref:WWE domain-containing protein n=1 Tax=Symbiodinium natans TaxID=878477 RepID=A0A812P845_9DINO|nr:unnamed protein product [Symbiodinium natans]